jgi:hypothetical protein
MLLLLKQSAPIGIIAIGMTMVMINGNIDLASGRPMRWRDRDARQHDLAVLWAWATGRSRWPGSWLLLTGLPAGRDQRADRLEDRGRCLHRHAGRDAGLPGPRLHVQRREPDLPPELDAGRFRRGRVPGPAHGHLVPSAVVTDRLAGSDDPHGAWPQRLCHRRQPRGGGQCGHPRRPAHDDQLRADRLSRGALGGGLLFRKRLGEPQ